MVSHSSFRRCMAEMERDFRMLGELETGIRARVTVTLVDGLVLARSAFDHSMNYRSVVAFGTARKVMEPEQKIRSLRVISEHLIAGRWKDVREPSGKELRATAVLEFSIEEASSKVRSGPPVDDESDYGLPVWAGVLPLETKSRRPIPDDRLLNGVTLPDYVRLYDGRLNGRMHERKIDPTEEIGSCGYWPRLWH